MCRGLNADEFFVNIFLSAPPPKSRLQQVFWRLGTDLLEKHVTSISARGMVAQLLDTIEYQ